MSPLMMRFFTLVGIALAIASLQMKARAGSPGEADAHRPCVSAPAPLAAAAASPPAIRQAA